MKTIKGNSIILGLLCLTCIGLTSCITNGNFHQDNDISEISKVRIYGEAGRRRNIQKEHLFNVQCGRNKNNVGYEDWENDLMAFYKYRNPVSYFKKDEVLLCEYTGVGKVLEAAVLYAWSDKDEALGSEVQKWIDYLIQSQDQDGYYGIYSRSDQENDYSFLWQSWIIHDGVYIAKAFLKNYQVFGDTASMIAAKTFLDLVIDHWEQAPVQRGVLSPIGIVEALYALYEATGEKKYLNFAVNTPFDGRFIEMDPISTWKQELFHMQAPSQDNPDARFTSKVHTYRFFEKCINQLIYFDYSQDSSMLVMSDYALAKMTDEKQPGMFISGATGRSEGWVEDQKGIGGIGEACAVVHQIWLMKKLIQIKDDLSYGDYMERMILNHMFAAQNPDPEDGRTRYFVPLSGKRNYNKGAHCCEGNTRRFWARLPELIYSKDENHISVLMYTSSVLETELKGKKIKITQQTDYPRNGEIKIVVDPLKKIQFNLRLRIPAWAKDYEVLVNGKPEKYRLVKGGIELNRTWRKGDTVELSLPMDYRWVSGKLYYDGKAALMRGPMVFCVSKENNTALQNISINSVVFDPASVKWVAPEGQTDFRNGQSAMVTGTTKDGESYNVIFNDFPEESGEETYFHITDRSSANQDELYRLTDMIKLK